MTTLISDHGPFGPGTFLGYQIGSSPGLTDPFSMTVVTTITHESQSDLSIFEVDFQMADGPPPHFPEPTSLINVLSGALFISAALFWRRRRQLISLAS